MAGQHKISLRRSVNGKHKDRLGQSMMLREDKEEEVERDRDGIVTIRLRRAATMFEADCAHQRCIYGGEGRK